MDMDDVRHDETLGPYRVIRGLGTGGMGEVLLARDPRLDREVAIKRIRSGKSGDEARARFQREARLSAAFNHPAIVQVYDLLVEDGAEHIVMEYVAGQSLRALLREHGPLAPREGLRIARSVAEGLAYAHARGVIHRDLKTENVLLTADGQAKITDFGIARRVDGDVSLGTRGDETDGDDGLTRQGTVLGTCRAMSPEQVGAEPLDARCDLFAFGTLLYETFTGQSPFQAASDRETLRRILEHTPRPVEELVSGLPPELSDLIGRLLAKAPDLRPREAEEVVRALAELEQHAENEADATLELTVESAGKPSGSSPAPRWRGALLVAASALVLLAKGLVLVWANRDVETVATASQPYPYESLWGRMWESEVSTEELGTYLKIQQAWNAKSGVLDTAALLVDLEALRRQAPRFLDVLLLEAEVAIGRFHETGDDALRRQAYECIAEAEALQSGSPEVLRRKLYVEQQARDLDAAEATLHRLAALLPGDVRILDQESLILEKQGRLHEALERAEAAMRHRPSLRRLYRHAVLAKNTGAMAAARESLEQVLAISPEDVRGISLLAQLELTYGDPRRTVELLSPRDGQARATWQWTSLALAHMLLRDYAASARASEEALALKPGNPSYLLNLADARWLEGRRDEALELYRQVLAVDGEASTDPRKLLRRAQALAHLGERHGAVEAVQEVLGLAPQDPEAVFTAALVYTVVGDETSAAVQVRRALELGYARRWFELSWFDELRGQAGERTQSAPKPPSPG